MWGKCRKSRWGGHKGHEPIGQGSSASQMWSERILIGDVQIWPWLARDLSHRREVILSFWASVSSPVKEEARSIRKGPSKERGGQGRGPRRVGRSWTGGRPECSVCSVNWNVLLFWHHPAAQRKESWHLPSLRIAGLPAGQARSSFTLGRPSAWRSLCTQVTSVEWMTLSQSPLLQMIREQEQEAGFHFQFLLLDKKKGFSSSPEPASSLPLCLDPQRWFWSGPLRPLDLSHLPLSLLRSFLCLCTLFVWQVPWELAKPWGHFPVTDTL